MGIELKIEELKGENAPLFCQYPLQAQAQSAYVELDENGLVTASYNSEIGNALPVSVWKNCDLRFAVSACVSGIALYDYLSGDGKALLECIHQGHEVVWDGNNHVGTLTQDAKNAVSKLNEGLEQLDLCEVWNVKDWLFSSCDLLDIWSGKSLADAVAELKDTVPDNVKVDGDIEDVLLEAAESYFDADGDDKLDEHHLAALFEAGKVSQEQLNDRAAALAEAGVDTVKKRLAPRMPNPGM